MDALWIVVISFVGYIIAYRTYGRFLASKVFGLEPIELRRLEAQKGRSEEREEPPRPAERTEEQ